MFAGGYFGAGWFRDLWRIPEYVKDANEEPSYMAELAQKISKNEKPSSGSIRYFGMMIVADTFGYLATGAIPKELVHERVFQLIAALTAPLASALGMTFILNQI